MANGYYASLEKSPALRSPKRKWVIPQNAHQCSKRTSQAASPKPEVVDGDCSETEINLRDECLDFLLRGDYWIALFSIFASVTSVILVIFPAYFKSIKRLISSLRASTSISCAAAKSDSV